jgi:hypothetical protein
VAEARERLADERNRAIAAAQEVKDELAVQVRDRGRIHAAHHHLMRRFKEHHGRMEELANFLLQTYRNANLKTRLEKPPKHFQQAYSFPAKDLPPLHEEALDKAKLEAAENSLNEGVDAVTQAFDNAIDSFTPLEELKKDLEDGAL